jgi:hypothetical protein
MNFTKFEHSKDEWDNVAPIVYRLNKFINGHLNTLFESQKQFLKSDAFNKDISAFKN